MTTSTGGFYECAVFQHQFAQISHPAQLIFFVRLVPSQPEKNQGADERTNAKPNAQWQLAMRPGKRKKRDDANSPIDARISKIEKYKASIRFVSIKRQFGLAKVR